MPFKDKHGRTCGFLDLDESDKRKKFLRRYFVLNKPNGVLEWFMDSPSIMSGDAQPCGSIKLDYITKVDKAKKMKIDFCFVINTPFRPYYVQANNENELDEWVEILNDASKITVPPEAMHPQTSTNNEEECESTENKQLADEKSKSNCTYRTEIVGNVVVKKRISESKRPSEDQPPTSPPPSEIGSDFKSSLSPDSVSLHSNIFPEKDIIKKGWAVKQGHVRKNWKRRFFVLKRRSFAYYKSDHDKEPIRTIPIGDVLTAKLEEGDLSKQRDNLLLVATTDKLYYIQADTPGDMLSWVEAFNDAIQNNLRLTGKKHQAAHHRTKEIENLVVAPDSDPASPKPDQPLKKQTSAIQLTCTPPQMGANSVEKDAASGLAASVPNGQKKRHKTHRRAESEVTAMPAHALEVMPIQIGSSGQSSDVVTYHAEDVRARPESVSLGTLTEHSWNLKSSSSSSGSASGGPNQTHQGQDGEPSRPPSHVDTRSALKPSAVRKKRNPGVLFPFNAMLRKKQDHIDREESRHKPK